MKKNTRRKDNSRILTLSAVIIGYAMIGDYSAYEQNAIGNWLMLIGQILETNSAFQQRTQESMQGNTYNINSKKYKGGGSAYMDNLPDGDHITPDNEEIQKIKNALQDILDRLEKLEH